MKIKVAEENQEAELLIPPSKPDSSGIGVNYTDAYLKVLNTQLETGEKLACKRKGLKLLLSLGEKKGEVLMCKRTNGPDVRNILREALTELFRSIGTTFTVDGGVIYLEMTPAT